MGGIGSGRRWQHSSASTTDEYLTIDIRKWHRENRLIPGASFYSYWGHLNKLTAFMHVTVELSHIILTSYYLDHDGEWKNIKFVISIDSTACNLGGHRLWFRCPNRGCIRRAAILYGGSIFACRHCYRLAYQSQREHAGNRAIRKADRIRERLEWGPGIVNGEGLKPKGMHWKTFTRLRLAHNELANFSWQETISRFGIDMLDLY